MAYSAKQTIIACSFIAFAQFLFGLDEALVKLYQVPAALVEIGEYSIFLLLAIVLWNIEKPSNIHHWYGMFYIECLIISYRLN